MRLTLDYEINPTKIPRIYRIGFASLIKKLIESQNTLLYEFYYKQHRLKPFTFSVYFPKMQKSNDENFNVGEIAVLNFSTFSLELASYIYNGFKNVDEHKWKHNGYEISFKPVRAFLRPEKKINSEEIVVKTLSPLLVNNLGDSNKFLLPGEEGFFDGLEFSVRECAKKFLGYKDFHLQFEVKSWEREVIYHYQKMPAMKGILIIRSKPEVLQMIYDIGLGVHRSQGFGMLEVIK